MAFNLTLVRTLSVMHVTLDFVQCIKCTMKLKVILTGNYLNIVSCNIIIMNIVFFSIRRVQRAAYFERVSSSLVFISRGLFMHALKYLLCVESKEQQRVLLYLSLYQYYNETN